MSELDNPSISRPMRPTTKDRAVWRIYWQQSGQPWRIEPEIDEERQKYLAERRAISPDIEKGIYPVKDIKLSRADVEWLLITHENDRGPVDWSDESQREREGIDLRGADVTRVDLSGLPLSCVLGGLTGNEWYYASPEQCEMAAIHLEETLLIQTHLEGAKLNMAYLKRANLFRGHLEGAEFRSTSLEKAHLNEAHLEGSILRRSNLEGVNLTRAHLEGANLFGAFFDSATQLRDATLGRKGIGYVWLGDVNWGNANLAVMDWSPLDMLGDEQEVRRKKRSDGTVKNGTERLSQFGTAVRANRQLAIALQEQGLNEVALRFAYHAQRLQRIVLRRQYKFGQYTFSLFLDLLAGYGYRPGRSVIWYLIVICGFATVYSIFGHLPLLPDAFVFSLTSFHGRGFFPGLGSETTLHNTLVVLAAAEAVIGLFIEISFIATFTQRYFGK